MATLIGRARSLDYHKIVLMALASNEVGRRLYEYSGFSAVGTYREHGMLDGRWVDVVVMEQLP